jgi:hypothetical protein
MSVDRKIPYSLFTTEHVVRREQFDFWRESISVVFQAEPLPEHEKQKDFAASVRAFHLGALMVSQVEFEAQRFVRDRKRTAADGLDHYLVHLYASRCPTATCTAWCCAAIGGQARCSPTTCAR